jgi:hypothetical protein
MALYRKRKKCYAFVSFEEKVPGSAHLSWAEVMPDSQQLADSVAEHRQIYRKVLRRLQHLPLAQFRAIQLKALGHSAQAGAPLLGIGASLAPSSSRPQVHQDRRSRPL